MTCRTPATALGLALLLAFAPTASGQPKPKPETETRPQTQAQEQGEDRCRLVPGGDDAARLPGGEGPVAEGGDSLSDRLGDCDGVLEPPPVRDPEIVLPPPDTGETPVIPPERLPEQQDAE